MQEITDLGVQRSKSYLENEIIDFDTTCKTNQTIQNLTVTGVKECLRECEKVGSYIFAFENNTYDACAKDGSCECMCYAEKVTMETCQLEYSATYDLHRIVDLDEKVCIRIIKVF